VVGHGALKKEWNVVYFIEIEGHNFKEEEKKREWGFQTRFLFTWKMIRLLCGQISYLTGQLNC